jgi:anti-sigma factor RsiW
VVANRVRFAVRQAARKESPSRAPMLIWTAAAAALIATVSVTAFLNRPVPPDLLAAEVVDSHVRSLQPGHLIDVPSSDRHTVKPWFQGKLDFSPPVPDLSARGWNLTGGRLDYLDRRAVAALVYQRGKHEINVYIWPNPKGDSSDIRQSASRGYQILHWNDPTLNYWVVSDLNPTELREFAQALRAP